MTDQLIIPIEYRADESRQTPGKLVGTLMPYEQRAGDRPEMFDKGSLYWPNDGIVIRAMHRRDSPILRTLPIDDGDAIRIDDFFPNTTAGRDGAENLRRGVYKGLSVEFASEKETRRGGVRVIQRARLTGAGLVDIPSYQTATAEVRQRSANDDRVRRHRWL